MLQGRPNIKHSAGRAKENIGSRLLVSWPTIVPGTTVQQKLPVQRLSGRVYWTNGTAPAIQVTCLASFAYCICVATLRAPSHDAIHLFCGRASNQRLVWVQSSRNPLKTAKIDRKVIYSSYLSPKQIKITKRCKSLLIRISAPGPPFGGKTPINY
jgi:hypothetical protein